MTLLGMELNKARQVIGQSDMECECVPYCGTKPYENADTARVVRVKKLNEKKYQLVYCRFISVPKTDSQGL